MVTGTATEVKRNSGHPLISGVILIAGILTIVFGSFLAGLIATIIGFIALVVFARGRWY
jgi:hypothetical protein